MGLIIKGTIPRVPPFSLWKLNLTPPSYLRYLRYNPALHQAVDGSEIPFPTKHRLDGAKTW